MKWIVLFFFLFLELSLAENNLTKKIETTLLDMIAPSNKEVNEKNILLIKEAIHKKKEENTVQKQEEEKLKQQQVKEEKLRLKEVENFHEEQKLIERLKLIEDEKIEIDAELSKDNIWVKIYQPHETYQVLEMQGKEHDSEIKSYLKKEQLNEEEASELLIIQEEYKVIEGKLSQLNEYKLDPFTELLETPKLEAEPTITNPLDIITAMSYQKHLKTLKEENSNQYKTLEDAVGKLQRKNLILQELVLSTSNKKFVLELSATEDKLVDFERTLAVFKISEDTFTQKVSQINLNIDKGIDKEIKKSILTGSIILFMLLFFFFVRFLISKYMSDNELFYSINKVINFIFIFLVFLILLFTYLENVENLMTILSFASAGIAIALKDWFMSLLGWVVILVSGSIHVGDRVKFVKDGVEYVGDIVDISVLRMTLHEDVTLTTVVLNKRAGRIIFIPNNYIFTDMIANYSHSGLKTVWDGIEFMITFDSNIPKAQSIAKEVTRKYSKGYTDMTRKQLNRLRSKYSMRNTAVEPRIFGFIDVYGVKISAWYLTNAYATLTLRSTISMEILSRLQEEDDIHLALPSQSLYMDKAAPRVLLKDGDEPSQEHRVN